MTERATVKIPRTLWNWRRLPLGTRAHAVMGGWWERTIDGWKANGGDTFPTPGGDVVSVEVPCLTDEDIERLQRYIESDLLVSLDMAMALGELTALRARVAELSSGLADERVRCLANDAEVTRLRDELARADLRNRALTRRVDEQSAALQQRGRERVRQEQRAARSVSTSELAMFERACSDLQVLASRGLHVYLANSELHLMRGPSHDDAGRPLQHNSITSNTIPGSGGGDW